MPKTFVRVLCQNGIFRTPGKSPPCRGGWLKGSLICCLVKGTHDRHFCAATRSDILSRRVPWTGRGRHTWFGVREGCVWLLNNRTLPTEDKDNIFSLRPRSQSFNLLRILKKHHLEKDATLYSRDKLHLHSSNLIIQTAITTLEHASLRHSLLPMRHHVGHQQLLRCLPSHSVPRLPLSTRLRILNLDCDCVQTPRQLARQLDGFGFGNPTSTKTLWHCRIRVQ
jgi:hypothetical protein